MASRSSSAAGITSTGVTCSGSSTAGSSPRRSGCWRPFIPTGPLTIWTWSDTISRRACHRSRRPPFPASSQTRRRAGWLTSSISAAPASSWTRPAHGPTALELGSRALIERRADLGLPAAFMLKPTSISRSSFASLTCFRPRARHGRSRPRRTACSPARGSASRC